MNRRRVLVAAAVTALALAVPVTATAAGTTPTAVPTALPTTVMTPVPTPVPTGTPAAGASPGGSAPADPRPEPTFGLTVGAQDRVGSGSLFGIRTIAPGFDETRDVVVRNDGSVPGELVLSVVQARLHQEPRDDFFDDLTVNGVTASDLAGQDTVIHTELLAPGESAVVPVRLAFAEASTSGNAAEVGEETFSFWLRADLTDASGRADVTGPVAQTGGLARAAGPWLVLAAGALALAWAVADRRRGASTD
ncbi:hypothetical protein [Cellulomonas wangsupingiae]|uniref:hypothetical protein n=1 Tax=Cellulomonas wangsupingiae TaxID=2968085 RepID=UPI001D0DD860|nr:hypothetical protein [Cellulomonas wangsupingiae]MCM0639442.1 hypothetical protein [Cellulomonas wangsupingiae]